jgi:spore germination cell wall hydrolase CwlJ-like protein
MNRAYSGRYPPSYCAVVKQPWQFSFVRGGRFPPADTSSPAWAYAQAIARIAKQRLADKLPDDVLWYHADYVAPVWGRRLSRVEKIGAHIFYRS